MTMTEYSFVQARKPVNASEILQLTEIIAIYWLCCKLNQE